MGDLEAAGLAALTIIEELGEHLPSDDLAATYDRAAELLGLSRQSLESMLKGKGRHRALAELRTPVEHRRSSFLTPYAWFCPASPPHVSSASCPFAQPSP